MQGEPQPAEQVAEGQGAGHQVAAEPFQVGAGGEGAVGAYDLFPFDAADVAAARDVIETYRELGIGLADASIVVLAGRFGTSRVLTLDERHFRTLLTPRREPFTVLPADSA